MSQCAVENCRFQAMGHDPRCAVHLAPTGDEAAKAELRRRHAAGGPARARTAAKKKRTGCSLRTPDDLLLELERALVRVDNAGGEASAKATAICRLVAEARAVLKAAELETENAELRKLLIERHPELKRHLSPVK